METEKQTAARLVFGGIRECSEATHTPIDILLRAKEHPETIRGTFGFHESGRIYWNIPTENGATLEKWIADHKPELESVTGETREHWSTRKERANALLAELELEEKYKRIVNKKDVVDLLDRIGAAQVSLFNSRLRQELPARWNLPPEKIAELDAVITELFGVFTKGINAWK